MFRKIILIVSLCFINSVVLFADNKSVDYGYKVSIGIVYETVNLGVSDQATFTTQGILGENLGFNYFISLSSPYRYFNTRSKWGYYFETNLSNFRLNHQRQNLDDIGMIDLGTSAEGYYAYIAPVVFYNFWDRHIKNGSGSSFKIGLGYGLGYLKAKGDVILTKLTPQVRHEFDISRDGRALVLLFDYRIDNWLFRISNGGPNIEHNGRIYKIYNESLRIGYTFTF